MKLPGKVAVVTGAAQGIGATYARALAAEGACVGVCDIQDPSTTVDQIVAAGGKAIGMIADIVDATSMAKLAAETVKAFGGIHILVNNAAIFGNLTFKPFTEIDAAEWDRVMTVNVRGSLECVKAVLPYMREQKYGKIINISSGTIYRGMPYLMHYVTSKGAVVVMTRCLARELGDHGIRVNCISPGLTLSEAVRNNNAYTETFSTTLINVRAIKREEVPEDLVGTLIYLSSPDSDFVTGQTIVVDGGSTMR